MAPISLSRLTLALLLSSSSLALAQETSSANKTIFWIDHDVLRWSSDKTKVDEGDDQEVSGLVTTPNDVTIGIFWKDYGLYVTPGDRGGLVGLSYYLTKELEIGLNLGLDNSTIRNQAETGADVEAKSTKLGLFGIYYLPLAGGHGAEFGLSALSSQTEVETEPATGPRVTSPDVRSTDITLLAQYAFNVAEHFAIVPGVSLVLRSGKDKVADRDLDGSGLTINLAHFRYIF